MVGRRKYETLDEITLNLYRKGFKIMDIFDEMKSIGKHTCVAKIGGFRPENTDLNWFGGNFSRDPKEAWPEVNGSLLVPLLQIYIPDIKDGHKIFGDHMLIQIYIEKDHLPMDINRNGDGWKIVFYKDINLLEITETPEPANILKPFPVRWKLNEVLDYPCWEEAWEHVDLTEINENEELNDRFFDEFNRYAKTKIGGYASYIQSPISDEYEFILQISSEEKPGLMIGDNGNIYIYKSNIDNDWYLYWDCY